MIKAWDSRGDMGIGVGYEEPLPKPLSMIVLGTKLL